MFGTGIFLYKAHLDFERLNNQVLLEDASIAFPVDGSSVDNSVFFHVWFSSSIYSKLC